MLFGAGQTMFEPHVCNSGQSALDAMANEQFDLILLDYKMPGLNGLDTLREVRRSQIKTPVIIMTAYGTTDTAIETMKLGAYDYLLKSTAATERTAGRHSATGRLFRKSL